MDEDVPREEDRHTANEEGETRKAYTWDKSSFHP